MMEDDDASDGDEEIDDEEESTVMKKPGCAGVAALLGGIALGCGVYLMYQWDAMSGGGKAGSVVLIVIGTLLVLPIVALLALKIVLAMLFGKIARELKTAGDQFVDGAKSAYGSVHQFRAADDEDFDELDRGYYESTAAMLESRGWRRLGDLIDSTIEQTGQSSPPIRVLSSPDGTTTVGLFHFVNEDMPEAAMRVCDVATEFTDGTFILTSNTGDMDAMTPPPAIRRLKLPRETSVDDLLAAHETEKQKLSAAKPGVSCVIVSTLAEAIESEKRQQMAKNLFRKEIGYIDPEEVRRVAEKTDGDAEFTAMVVKAAEEARRREQEQGGR